ncbi:MAG: carbohydrate kinase, partial [Candidatus Hydrogenedentes bacterium]|nr:carbohydrate kinase [Candidatus Hydrogenedentota bacterium]
YYWEKFCASSRQLMLRAHAWRDAIAGVAVTTQRGTYINVDASGGPLRPAIVWLDQRDATGSDWATPTMKLLYKGIGLYRKLDDYHKRCYANWIREHQPEIWARTHKFLLLSGYFHYKLTGRFVESLGNNMGYLPVDAKTHRWAKKDSLLGRLFPIDETKLPDLVRQTEIIGEISRGAAEETGLPAGLPVVAAANDKGCEILGAGVMSPETGCVSYGTIATINAVSPRYVEVMRVYPPFPAAVPDLYYTELSVVRGYWMVRWFMKEFGFKEEQMARERGVPTETLLDEMIKQVPPGADGLVLQPYWHPFWSYCGAEGRGSIIGFRDVHTRAHLYRAILEGIAYELKSGAIVTQKKHKVRFASLRVSGGGAQSDTAMQITADVFGLPAERPHTTETSALGAAIDAAVGLGYYPDFGAAVRAMTRCKDRFEPVPANQELYRELYGRVYSRMYSGLRPQFSAIMDIMGRRRADAGDRHRMV